ncbi:hypothetical protein SLE2022_012030 [Rubroshorea leprosula]
MHLEWIELPDVYLSWPLVFLSELGVTFFKIIEYWSPYMQVMTVGQRASFDYHGNNYIFTVNQAVLEGQEKSNAIERGMISNETYIIYEASNSSGIKIVNQREAASNDFTVKFLQQ